MEKPDFAKPPETPGITFFDRSLFIDLMGPGRAIAISDGLD